MSDNQLETIWSTWPVAEQNTWQQAVKPANTVLDETNAMQKLARRSVELYAREATWCRAWAERQGVPPGTPHDRLWSEPMTKQLGAAMVRLGYSSSTRRLRLIAIERVMHACCPTVDTRYLLDLVNAISRAPDDDWKFEHLRDPEALFDCGMAYINQADEFKFADVVRRTGLAITFLSQHPYRLEHFTALHVLKSKPSPQFKEPYLVKEFGAWWIRSNVQNQSRKRPPIDMPLDPGLTQPLEDFVDGGARDRLCRQSGYVGTRLWVSQRGPLNPNGMYKQVVLRTEKGLGVAVNPHLFRDCYATYNNGFDEDGGPSAHDALGNKPPMTKRIYDHSVHTAAAGLKIGAAMNALIDARHRNA